jgi:hypothetical protein
MTRAFLFSVLRIATSFGMGFVAAYGYQALGFAAIFPRLPVSGKFLEIISLGQGFVAVLLFVITFLISYVLQYIQQTDDSRGAGLALDMFFIIAIYSSITYQGEILQWYSTFRSSAK